MKPSHGFLGGLAAGVALDVHSLYMFGAGVLVGVGLSKLAGLLRWARRQALRPGFGSGSTKVW